VNSVHLWTKKSEEKAKRINHKEHKGHKEKMSQQQIQRKEKNSMQLEGKHAEATADNIVRLFARVDELVNVAYFLHTATYAPTTLSDALGPPYESVRARLLICKLPDSKKLIHLSWLC